MTNPLKAAGQSVVAIIQSANLDGNGAEYAELVLDSMITGDALKEIPVVNTALAIGRLAFGIRDYLLTQKLARFLGEISSVSPEARIEMVRRLDEDPGYAAKVGEHVIELLDRAESDRKPEMIARVFAAYADDQIDRPMMFRLLTAVERMPVAELSHVRAFHSATYMKNDIVSVTDGYTDQVFANAGLAIISAPLGDLSYRANDVCSQFVKLNLDTAGLNAEKNGHAKE